LRYRWGQWIARDPFYNPNLSLEKADGSYACPPRVSPPGSPNLE
jgi:hypothetical protein